MSELLKPRVAVLKTDGTNCDRETAFAFNQGGGDAEIIRINQLRRKERNLQDYQIVAITGGFSYGDDLGSGKIFARIDLMTYLADQVNEAVQRRNALVLGVCNGMQVLTQSGLLPFGNLGDMQVAMDVNEGSGGFYSEPIKLKVEKAHACGFVKEMPDIVEFKVAHGEGNTTASPQVIQRIEDEKLVVFRYCNPITGEATQEYPFNPNGSTNAIAGFCDPSGNILGLMPHPERSVKLTQYSNWRRLPTDFKPEGLILFESMVDYANQGV